MAPPHRGAGGFFFSACGGLSGPSGGPLGGLLEDSWGVLEASWGTPGGLWAALWRRGRVLIDFGAHFGVPKSLNFNLNFALNLNIDSDSFFGPSWGLWGSFGARFWAHFGFEFELPRREA